jgi:hypothetical protein
MHHVGFRYVIDGVFYSRAFEECLAIRSIPGSRDGQRYTVLMEPAERSRAPGAVANSADNMS